MTTNRSAILALAAAGALWGLTVPLSKLSLDWLGGGLADRDPVRDRRAAAGLAGRRGLRAALTPRIAAAGAIGFGAVIVLQNAGIERTSVTHAALVVGAVPVMVALMAAALGHGVARPVTWARLRPGARRASRSWRAAAAPARRRRGDLLVLASVALSATFIVVQPRAARRARPGRGHRGAVRAPARSSRSRTRSRSRACRPRRRRPGRWSRSSRWRSRARCCRSGCSPSARRTSRRARGRVPEPRAARRRRGRLGRLRRGGRGQPAARRRRPCWPASRSAPTTPARRDGARAAGARAPGGR